MIQKKIIISIIFISITFGLFSDDLYVIQKGDTLYSISKKYDVVLSEIIDVNKIADISSVSIGTELKIPRKNKTSKYIVSKGDTLFSISKKFNVPLSSIISYNELNEEGMISLGQSLTIPTVIKEDKKVEVKIVKKNESRVLGSVPYWPITGDVKKYSGRIQGVQIDGESGDYIQAVSSGRVIWYDSYKGIGKVVLIEGDNGYDYLYGTKENLNVSMGVEVTAGDRLGRLKDDNTTIIFSVFKNGKPLLDISEAPR